MDVHGSAVLGIEVSGHYRQGGCPSGVAFERAFDCTGYDLSLLTLPPTGERGECGFTLSPPTSFSTPSHSTSSHKTSQMEGEEWMVNTPHPPHLGVAKHKLDPWEKG